MVLAIGIPTTRCPLLVVVNVCGEDVEDDGVVVAESREKEVDGEQSG